MEKLEKRDLGREEFCYTCPETWFQEMKNTIRFYNMAIYKTFTVYFAISVENMELVVGRLDIKLQQGR